MRNPKKRPIIPPRKTAFLLIFSMLLSVFTVFPSFAEGSSGEVTPRLPDTALSDEIVTDPSVNIETEPMQTETAVAAVASTPVINNQPNTTISVSRGVDMSEDDIQSVLIVTTLPVQKMDVIIDKTSIVSAKTEPENIATNSYAFTIEAKEIGIATVSVKVTSTTGVTETVSVEIYVVLDDGVYAIKSKATQLPTDLGNYYLRVQTSSVSLSDVVASTHTYGDVPGNIDRYWNIEYAGNGEYYIRCLERQNYSLAVSNGSATIALGAGAAQRWVIRYNYGAYELVTCSVSNYSNGVLLISTNAQTAYYNSGSPYYFVEPIINQLQGAQFELWDFEPIHTAYFRDSSDGDVSTTFSASIAVMEGETIDLADLGYEFIVGGIPSTAPAYWVTHSFDVATVNSSTGVMTAVGDGTTTITVGISEYDVYRSFTLTLMIKPLTNGTYFLRNLQTNLHADVQNGSMTNGNEIEQQTYSGTNIQKWRFIYHSEGNVYTIRTGLNNSYYLGVENNSTTVDANIVLRTGTVTSGMKWRVTEGRNGYKISAYSNSSLVLATSTSNATSGAKLVLATWTNDTNYRDEWDIHKGTAFVEFSYDMGFIDANRASGESDSVVKSRIQQNIKSVFFPVVANAFAKQCGIYFMISSSIANYTSDADLCPNSEIDEHCSCVNERDCLLQYSHNPNSNNSSVGYQYDVHCKSFTRLRNNLIVDIPSNTIRITYSGHELCFYSASDSVDVHTDAQYHVLHYDTAGLADYNHPIICINESQNSVKRSILVMAHEMTHLYGIEHHAPIAGQPCIMDKDRYDKNDPNNPGTYWCDNCINTMASNRNKY